MSKSRECQHYWDPPRKHDSVQIRYRLIQECRHCHKVRFVK